MTTKGDKRGRRREPTSSTRSPIRRPRRAASASKLADELADDADFLRKLKPSLIAARAKGEAPKDARARLHASRPVRPAARQAEVAKSGGGPNPFLVAGAAFGVGTLLAKVIDWRGHAHPRH